MFNNILLFLAKSPCDNITILKIFYLLKKALSVVFLVVPLILIVLVIIDFTKNVVASDEEAMKKNKNLAIKRIIYAVAVFFVPAIVNLFMSAIGDLGLNYSECMTVTMESLTYKIENQKNSCTSSDMEWNDVLNECVKKKNYSRIDSNSFQIQGTGGLSAKQDDEHKVSNSSDKKSINGYNGDLVYYNQCSSEWKNEGFCNTSSDMCNNGCGAAAIAMVAASFGNNSSTNPVTVRDYLCSNGLHSSGGLGYDAFTNTNLLNKFGINGQELISANESKTYDSTKTNLILENVNKGKAVILLIPGHYVVIGQNKKCSGNEVYMYDPASSTDSNCYTMESLWDKTWNRKNRCNNKGKCGWRRAWSYTKG